MVDKCFGEMHYDGGWVKNDKLSLWGKEVEAKIVVSAYENEMPNAAQQDAYERLMSDTDSISKITLRKLKEYMKIIESDIVVYCEIKEIPEDVFELVSIDNILFTESGSLGIMCKAKWDSHGIAVLCKECEVEVGPQDIVWMDEY